MTNATTERVRAVLEERARVLARHAETGVKRVPVATVAVVHIGAERFGFPVEGLREIVPRTRELALPGLPPWIIGVAQIRHQLLSVVDLTRRLAARGVEAAEYLVVVDGQRGALAVLADEVIGLRRVYADELAPGLLESERLRALPVQTVTKDFIIIVDIERLLQLSAVTELGDAAGVTLPPASTRASEDE